VAHFYSGKVAQFFSVANKLLFRDINTHIDRLLHIDSFRLAEEITYLSVKQLALRI
jgi:hypothetical protein